jgi:NitT/TauT family transport system permease protein
MDETEVLVAQTLRARRNARIFHKGLGVAFPLLLLGLWEVFSTLNLIDRRFFPNPTTIAQSIFTFLSTQIGRDLLMTHLQATLIRIGVGFGIGATSGVLIGLIMGLHAPTRSAFAPTLYAIFPLPKIAIYPLMIVLFGLGDASTFALVTLGVFFMTCINTFSGVRYLNPIFHDVANGFRMPPLVRWFRVFIPAAMPAIITGLRLGLGQALVLVVSAEFVSADTGLGRLIWDSWQVLDIARMFMGLFVVLVLAGVAAVAGNLAENKLIPWHRR